MAKSVVCLNMIVKNEEAVILRCLKSVKHLVDRWVICDTGSTDRTKEIIQDFMKDKPGKLMEEPWKNFCYNRNIPLNGMYDDENFKDVTHVLIIDADEELKVPEGWNWPEMNPNTDGYHITSRSGTLVYQRSSMVNVAKHRWHWEGVVHEYLNTKAGTHMEYLDPNIHIYCHPEGARHKDPLKFVRDAKTLEQDLIDNPDDPMRSRTLFYTAQSWRDAGVPELGVKYYKKFLEIAKWDEEIFMAKLSIARLMQVLEYPPEQISWAYLDAHKSRPSRIEALVDLGKWHRFRGECNIGYMYLKEVENTPVTKDILFVEMPTYLWAKYDELSIAAYWSGRKPECAELCKKILGEGFLPENQIPRIKKNLNYALDLPQEEEKKEKNENGATFIF